MKVSNKSRRGPVINVLVICYLAHQVFGFFNEAWTMVLHFFYFECLQLIWLSFIIVPFVINCIYSFYLWNPLSKLLSFGVLSSSLRYRVYFCPMFLIVNLQWLIPVDRHVNEERDFSKQTFHKLCPVLCYTFPSSFLKTKARIIIVS